MTHDTTTQRLHDLLTNACEELDLYLTDSQREQLVVYTQTLEKWNKTYNLTAIRNVEDMMKRHVVDALSVVPTLQALSPKRLADIGTGGGVPGVVLAIVLPTLHVDLVESIGKKCRFLRHVINQLSLNQRVAVRQTRVEAWVPDSEVDVIICRAFTSLANFITITRHLGGKHAYWLAMKSAHTADEEKALPGDFEISRNVVLIVPYEAAARHLLIIRSAKALV